MRVIIAEDEALIRMDLREMLEEEGHEVVGEARNGHEVVEMARRLHPDLVFMDINMPEMSGIEAAAVINEESLAPVVMVTAFSQTSYVEEAADAGAMAYIVKPFARKDIVPAMQIAASRFAESRALAEEVEELSERLATRKVVDRAKGVLMGRGQVAELPLHAVQHGDQLALRRGPAAALASALPGTTKTALPS